MATTGDDTINSAGFLENIDGLAGNDLLVITDEGVEAGKMIVITRYSSSLGTTAEVQNSNGSLLRSVNITNIERYDITSALVMVNLNDAANNQNNNFILTRSLGQYIYLGDGDNNISVGSGSNIISVGNGHNTVTTGAGTDQITVFGDTGNSTISSGGGDDVINVSSLLHHIDAGSGNDTLRYSVLNAENVEIDLTSMPANWSGIESLSVSLSGGDDTLRANHLLEAAYGGTGTDVLHLDWSQSAKGLEFTTSFNFDYVGFETFYMKGSGFADYIQTNAESDTIYGGAGNDSLYGKGGADLIYGGEGNDTIEYSMSDEDSVFGGAGNDLANVIVTASTAENPIDVAGIFASLDDFERISLKLTADDDFINLGSLATATAVSGTSGLDVVILDYSDVAMASDGAGFNFVFNTSYRKVDFQGTYQGVTSMNLRGFDSFIATGTDLADTFISGQYSDTLSGGAGNDTMTAYQNKDVLFGGAGNDNLISKFARGSTANDAANLSGGSGRDTFSIWNLEDTVDGGMGVDKLIVDLRTSKQLLSGDLGVYLARWTNVEEVTVFLNPDQSTVNIDGIYRLKLDADYDVGFKANFGGSGYDGKGISLSGGTLQDKSGGPRMQLVNFISADLTGSKFGDTINLDRNLGASKVYGLAGNDTISAASNCSLFGGEGDDLLISIDPPNYGKAEISGGTGNDRIFAYDRALEMSGGAGADEFYFMTSNRWGNIFKGHKFSVSDFKLGQDHLFVGGIKPADIHIKDTAAGTVLTWEGGRALLEDVHTTKLDLLLI